MAVLFTLPIRVSPTLYTHALTLLEVGDMALAVTPGFKHGSQLGWGMLATVVGDRLHSK